MIRTAVLVGALFLAAPAVAQDRSAQAGTVRDAALSSDLAWDVVESLTTEIGPRPSGSAAMERAKDWSVAKFEELGFENISVEPFEIEAWERGAEFAEIVGPFPQPLTILGLGRSVSTPAGGLDAEIVVFPALADLLAAEPGSLTGKIAFVNEPMVRTQDGSGYGAINAARTQGPGIASRLGAAGYLVRSLSTDDTDLPHTGAMTWPAGVTPIPSAAVSVTDATLLARMAERGPVTVHLELNSRTFTTTAWNISGEIVGTQPDEIIVIGGHLDSWDVGTGAVDDGAGIAVTTAAAKLAALPHQPRRTIRVVMWGAEEMGYSSAPYAAAHAREDIVLVSESDTGAGGIWALRPPPGGDEALAPLSSLLAALSIDITRERATGAGADVAGLVANGAPAFSFRLDASRYFDLHHSNDDTLDKIDPADLQQMTAAWATLLYLAANTDQRFTAE